MSRHPDGFPTLTLRGGGWIIVAFALVLGGFLAWAVSGIFVGERPVGGGSDPASYGFRLEPLAVPRETLVGTGNPRDFLATLDMPATIRGSEVLRWNQEHRGKLVVGNDRVAGVVVNGEARAYPLAMLNAHEVINDVLGGVPVAVTFSPLTDSLAVFDRRVGGTERMFGVSGLLLDSNLVIYDRASAAPGAPAASAPGSAATAPHEPSLWAQLPMRAIAGPAAAEGLRLVALPDANICSWRMWSATWPDTTVILGDPSQSKRYKELSYARYCLTPRVDFPVAGLMPASPEPQSADAAVEAARAGAARTRKAAVVEIREPGARATFSLAELAAKAGDGERTEVIVGGRAFDVTVQRAPMAALVRARDGGPAMVVPQLWFAWRDRG